MSYPNEFIVGHREVLNSIRDQADSLIAKFLRSLPDFPFDPERTIPVKYSQPCTCGSPWVSVEVQRGVSIEACLNVLTLKPLHPSSHVRANDPATPMIIKYDGVDPPNVRFGGRDDGDRQPAKG